MKDAIFNDPGHVVLGNPKGDVTLVEMFDYNCGYCRRPCPTWRRCWPKTPISRSCSRNSRSSPTSSVDAARVAVLVSQSDVDYWAFHQALFTSRGQVDKDTALAAAADLGLNRVDLELRHGRRRRSPSRSQTSYEIAKALNITGTPTYIIGDEIIPGAIGIDELRSPHRQYARLRRAPICERLTPSARLMQPAPMRRHFLAFSVHFV